MFHHNILQDYMAPILLFFIKDKKTTCPVPGVPARAGICGRKPCILQRWHPLMASLRFLGRKTTVAEARLRLCRMWRRCACPHSPLRTTATASPRCLRPCRRMTARPGAATGGPACNIFLPNGTKERRKDNLPPLFCVRCRENPDRRYISLSISRSSLESSLSRSSRISRRSSSLPTPLM